MSTVLTAPSDRKKKSFVKPQPSVRMRVWDQRSSISMAAPEMCWPKPMRAIGAQNLLTMPGGVSISGYLHKKGGSQFSLLKWPLRYVILHKGCVYYFKTSTSACPQGAFSLNGYNRVIRAAEETTSSNVFPFKIVHFSKKHRTWLFSAASEDERRKWMRGLRKEIDYYNDRRDSHIPSDDSDGESFYGTVERLMEIKTPADNADEDYTDDEDDEDDEDYLTPDSDGSPTSSIGRTLAPPPAYPPPPVPAPPALALPPPWPGARAPSPGSKKPPTPPSALPRDNGPPPPLPIAPHLHKSPSLSQPPKPPPPVPKHRRVTMTPEPGAATAGSTKEARTLPPLASMAICDSSRNRTFPGAVPNSSVGVEVTHSLGNSRPSFTAGPPPLPPPNATPPTKPLAVSPKCGRMDPQGKIRPAPLCQPSLSQPLFPPQPVAQPRPVPDRKPPLPKPPLPSAKPNRHGGSALERPSPDGRSFRNSVDEVPDDCKKRRDKRDNSGGDSDDDYESIHLPDSVYIDTTETLFVERLFKEGSIPPHNGLYGIRNSGTKTSKVLVVWDVSYGKARNYRVFEEEKSMYLERDLNFPSLAALIEHYHSHPLPQHNSLVLQRPYGYILPR